METMYFIFGVLSVIALIIVGVIIYGIVKVFKTEKRLHSLENHVAYFQTDMNDRFKDVYQQIEHHFASAKDISNTYTDTRVDKLENKLTGKIGEKQLIKG
jgi:hypothetical protein